MLKASYVFTTRRATSWRERSSRGRPAGTLALPSLPEPVADRIVVATNQLSQTLQQVWHRCTALVRPVAFRPAALQEAPSNFSAVLLNKIPSEDRPPGMWKRGRTRLSDFSQRLYRNIYPEFSEAEKKWIWRLVVANGVVFGLWQTYGTFPSGRQSMWEQFMISMKSVRMGRLWVFLTSAFSSPNAISFGLNSISIVSFGAPILAALGTGPFLALYFGSSIFGSLVHLESFAYPTQQGESTPNQLWYADHASMHSASAAATALAGFYGAAWATRPVVLASFVAPPSWVLAAGFCLAQFLHAENTRQPWYGNLGALAVGLAFGFLSRGRARI